jgi:mannonate dehydratase
MEGSEVTKLSMVAVPPTDERLATIRQIGVEHLVHYDMTNDDAKFERLEDVVHRAARFGLDVPVVEVGPAIDRIVLGLDGAEEQIERWVQSLGPLGRLGVEVVVYNFMPQLTEDAMVVRTDLCALTRGGAVTTAYRTADVTRTGLDDADAPRISFDEARDNLVRFLRRVIPAAEAAGVKLAMHPDDPPLTPIAGYARIMSSVTSFDWLLELHDSETNGMTLCTGCFGELGVDVPALVERFGKRIHFVHLRNIRGATDDFIETFPDEGDVDIVGTLRALDRAGIDIYARPDHSPRLATERQGTPGYGFDGHLFTLGYLRGVMHGLNGGAK